MAEKNKIIRSLAKEKGVALWQIADRLHMNDGNFSRKLRKELSDEEREKIIEVIEEISQEDN